MDAGGWLLRLKRAAYITDPDWPKHYEERRAQFNWLDWPDLPKQFDPDIQVLLPDYIPPPVVQLIEEPTKLHSIELPALLIDLKAPDGVIREQFEAALRAARERFPSPARKTGPKLDGRFGKRKFSTWRNYRILELAELLAWRAYDKVDATNVQLGRLLSDNANIEFDKKRTEAAKETLFDAIKILPALAAQVASEAQAEKISTKVRLFKKGLTS